MLRVCSWNSLFREKYIKDKTFDPTLSEDQKYRLKKQLSNDKFNIENDTLIYATLNLKIIPTAEYQKVLDEIYDKQVGIPSIHDFHNQVNKTHYINNKKIVYTDNIKIRNMFDGLTV